MTHLLKYLISFFVKGFRLSEISVKEVSTRNNIEYAIYIKSVIFWIPKKNKIGILSNLDDLNEVNKRCGLGLNLHK